MLYLFRTSQPRPDVGKENTSDSQMKRSFAVSAEDPEKAREKLEYYLHEKGRAYTGEEIVGDPYPVHGEVKQVDQQEIYWGFAQEA